MVDAVIWKCNLEALPCSGQGREKNLETPQVLQNVPVSVVAGQAAKQVGYWSSIGLP